MNKKNLILNIGAEDKVKGSIVTSCNIYNNIGLFLEKWWKLILLVSCILLLYLSVSVF